MSPRIPPSSSYAWTEPHQPPPPSPARHPAQAPDNPTPLRSAGTTSNEYGVELVDDGTVGCANRNDLIHWAINQVQPHMYVPLPNNGTSNQLRFGAKFTGHDGASREVYAVFHLDSDQNQTLISTGYRGPETQGDLISAASSNPARLASPPRRPLHDPTQAHRDDRAGQSSNPTAAWPGPQYESDNKGERDDQGFSFEQMTAAASASRRQGHESPHGTTVGAGPSRTRAKATAPGRYSPYTAIRQSPATTRRTTPFLLAPSGQVRLAPVRSEHQAVMAQLPTSLSRQQRSVISQFLCHLELQSLSWSTLAPAAGEVRPAALEAAVNTAITQHGLQSGTRGAINLAFNLALLGPAGQVRLAPVRPEHQAVMAQLPTTLSRQQRSAISRFLCHLEQQNLSWSALAPAAGEVRPAALEAAVNTAITQHGVGAGTRAAINLAFNLALLAPSGRVQLAPMRPEHQAVMAQLPTTLSQQHRSAMSRFLCHLEQLSLNWSALAPAAGEVRPAALEAAVNTAITQHRLNASTRSALNRAFHLVLLGPSGR